MGWVAQASNGSDSVPLEAVAITAGAVIVGAIIAAIAAQLRLQATLKAERERLDDQLEAERARLHRQLEAERARLHRQLEHDRELTDLAELRTLLDRVLTDALAAYESYLDLVQDFERELAQSAPADQRAIEERRVKLAGPAAEAALRVSADLLRVEARLPHDHAVVNALRDMRGAIQDWPAVESSSSPALVEAHQACVQRMGEAQGSLIVACHATIGSRIRAGY
jgi:flagellar motility protein MotE (MotC chaperone)